MHFQDLGIGQGLAHQTAIEMARCEVSALYIDRVVGQKLQYVFLVSIDHA
jgi:hypothetical protein